MENATKKTCPRAARENAKKKPEVNSWKTAHTGLRFHFDKKKLVTHELSFNSVSKTESKTEKVTRCHFGEKSIEKKNAEISHTTDTKDIKVLMDTLKISKSEECCTREKSPLRKEIPKSPVVERLTSKKACTRCSRCSRTPKEEKPEIKPLRVAKNQEQPLKTIKKETHCTKIVKIETPQSPKPAAAKNRCSKLAKLLAEPPEKTLKLKSILVHPEKSASRENEKNGVSKICEKSSPNMEKAKSCSGDMGKSNCTSEEKADFASPKSEKTEHVVFSTETADHDARDKGKSEIPNGTENPSEPDTKTCLLNGRHEEHLCDPHFRYDSSDALEGVEITKPASKIPRKMNSATGLKAESSMDSIIQF